MPKRGPRRTGLKGRLLSNHWATWKAVTTLAGVILILFMVTPARAQSGAIDIMRIDGTAGSDSEIIVSDLDSIRFVMRYNNNTGYKVDFCSGWRITSPDGAVWSNVSLDSISPHFRETGPDAFFDIAFGGWFTALNPGPPADTVGCLGAGYYTKAYRQMPNGFYDSALAVTVNFPPELAAANEGKHICIDSAFWGPGGQWVWIAAADQQFQELIPQFVGVAGQPYNQGTYLDRYDAGYCYRLSAVEGCSPNFVEPPTSPLPTNFSGPHCGTVFSYTFSCSDCGSTPVRYRKLQGPGTLDSVTGEWELIPTGAECGHHLVTVQCSDPLGSAGTQHTFELNLTNDAPIMLTEPRTTVGVAGQQKLLNYSADPVDCDKNLWTAKIIFGDTTGTCTIDSAGLLRFVPKSSSLHQIRVIVSDGNLSDTTVTNVWVTLPPGCCIGTTGELNGLSPVDLSDLSMLIAYLTGGYAPFLCLDEANINRTGIVDLPDLSMLIAYLTGVRSTLPNCF